MKSLPVEHISQKAFDSLLEYSASLPTGHRIGKTWKLRRPWNARMEDAEWYIGEYVSHPDPNTIGIDWRRIVVQP